MHPIWKHIFGICIVILITSISIQNYYLSDKVDRYKTRINFLESLIETKTNNHYELVSIARFTMDRILTKEVIVTAYSPRKEECNDDPFTAASMRPVKAGTIAVSRDLFDAGWVFGRKVYIKGLGIYEVNDLMNARYTNRIDIFMWDTQKAKQFGVRNTTASLQLIN